MKHIFVINPSAGRSDPYGSMKPKIDAACRDLGQDCVIYRPTGPMDAARYVRETCSAPENAGEELRFYSCGGDGTAGEMATGMAGFGNAALGVFPLGSGNDFVRSFPGTDFMDVAGQMTGGVRVIDTLKCGDRIGINLVNIGMDADVAAGIVRYKKLPFVTGPMSYEMSLVRTMLGRLGHRAAISLDGGEPMEINAVLTVMGNGCYYGGGYRGAPLAEPDDGLMDVCIVPKISRLTMARIIGSYKKGLHFEDERLRRLIFYRKAKRIELHYDRQVTVCIDGECYGGRDVTVELLPRSLRLIIPRPAETPVREDKGAP